METKLARISQLSKENPDMVFTSLGHLINQEMLKSCHTQRMEQRPNTHWGQTPLKITKKGEERM